MSQCHTDLHVWSYPRPDYIFQVSGVSEPQGVKIWPFPLLWLVAFTTACTTVQAVIVRLLTIFFVEHGSFISPLGPPVHLFPNTGGEFSGQVFYQLDVLPAVQPSVSKH